MEMRPVQFGVRPCVANPDGWDVDLCALQEVLAAVRACTEECPFLRECDAARREAYGDRGPDGMVQAGRAYTASGEEMDARRLMVYASAGNVRRRQVVAARARVAA